MNSLHANTKKLVKKGICGRSIIRVITTRILEILVMQNWSSTFNQQYRDLNQIGHFKNTSHVLSPEKTALDIVLSVVH